VKKKVTFISDISYVRYNIRLTQKGQLATFLYSRLAHKEATGNSAYFFEYKPHLTYSFKVACPSKEQVHEERVEVVIFRPNIWTKRRPNIQTILSTSLLYFEMRSIRGLNNRVKQVSFTKGKIQKTVSTHMTKRRELSINENNRD
jgi:hypothetical protein